MTDERPVYVVEDGLIRAGDKEILLSPRERAVMEMLLRFHPHFVPRERIATRIWPAQFPDSAINLVHQYAGAVRRKLRSVGIETDVQISHGYRLKTPVDVMHVTERGEL